MHNFEPSSSPYSSILNTSVTVLFFLGKNILLHFLFLTNKFQKPFRFGNTRVGGIDGSQGMHVLRFKFAIISSNQIPFGPSKLSLVKIPLWALGETTLIVQTVH